MFHGQAGDESVGTRPAAKRNVRPAAAVHHSNDAACWNAESRRGEAHIISPYVTTLTIHRHTQLPYG